MDDAIRELPKKRAKLEETRRLLERLGTREGDVSADHYERLSENYRNKIAALEKNVAELTDEGETRKIELEDRIDHHRNKRREAEEELKEIEALHKQGALDKETYKSQRKKLRREKKNAERKVNSLEKELDELNYYLTAVGEEGYQRNKLKGTLAAAGSEARKYGEKARDQLEVWTAGRLSNKEWVHAGVGIIIILFGVWLYWFLGKKGVPNEIGLNGNVRSVKRVIYKAHKKYGKLNKGNKLAVNYIIFNRKGNIVEKKSKSNKRDYKFHDAYKWDYKYNKEGRISEVTKVSVNEHGLQKRKVYRYNEEGNKITCKLYDAENKLLKEYNYQYDENVKLKEKIKYDANGDFDGKEVFDFDSNGHKIKKIIYTARRKLYYKEIYEYTENKKVKELKRYDSDGNLYDKLTFKYDEKGNEAEKNCLESVRNQGVKYSNEYKYDSRNNWIHRVIYKNEKPTYILERQILYYQ